MFVSAVTRPTLNFSPDPENFIDPLKEKSLICSKNVEHIFVFATTAKIWAVLHIHVCRGSSDTGNIKPLFTFNENFHTVFEFAMYIYSLQLQ
jgi:hypothetical protein